MLLETVRTGDALLAGPSQDNSAFFQARGLALALDNPGQARLPGGAEAVLNLQGAGLGAWVFGAEARTQPGVLGAGGRGAQAAE